MTDQETETNEPEQTDHHGTDAADKPEEGAKDADNPEFGEGTGEGQAGFTQTGGQGGGRPTEPNEGHDRANKGK